VVGYHFYIRFSYDGGLSWGDPIKIVGADGVSSATTVYAVIPDYTEVLKFHKEEAAEGEFKFSMAPSKIKFNLRKSSANFYSEEPMCFIP
jgi:hypothetical protein